MGARTIPDGAAITNHFTCSFSPHVTEANATMIGGIKDEFDVTDGPDARGYVTGKGKRQTITVSVPTHDPANTDFHAWKEKCENAALGHTCTGTVTLMSAADLPIEIWELENCICHGVDAPDMNLDGGEVGINKWTISAARCKRVGP